MRILIAAIVFAGLATTAGAATITNMDAQSYTLKITEGGDQSEVGISSGQSVTACNSGCFITMPNGDRETLTGNENVEISGGKAVIK
ncbi:MAG: hypothetical protein R3D32_09085 [Nitratireductor sp.]